MKWHWYWCKSLGCVRVTMAINPQPVIAVGIMNRRLIICVMGVRLEAGRA